MKNINILITIFIVSFVAAQLQAMQRRHVDNNQSENKQSISNAKNYQINQIRTVDQELIDAVSQNDTQTLGRLFNLQGKDKPDVNVKFAIKWHSLEQRQHEQFKKYLDIKDDESMNSTSDVIQITPLILAAYLHHPVVVNLLLKQGALVNQKDSGGKSPFSWATYDLQGAAVEQVTNILEQLKKAGADLREINERLSLLFDEVIGKNQKYKEKRISDDDARQYISWLIKNKVSVSKKDDQGITPLMHAVAHGAPRVVKTLLFEGSPDLNAEDNKGRTVFDWLQMRSVWESTNQQEIENILNQYKQWKTITKGTAQIVEGTMEALSPGSSARGKATDIISEYAQPDAIEYSQLAQHMAELEEMERKKQYFPIKSKCIIS